MQRLFKVRARVPLLGALAFAACGAPEPHRPERGDEPVAGTRLVVKDTLIEAMLELAGTAAPIRRATIASRLMAAVEAVPVQEGDRVAAGQLLVRLDARDLEARSGQAEAAASDAEAVLEQARPMALRMRALFADSAATRAQLEAADAALGRAEAAARAAGAARAEVAAQRAYAELRAPFAGTVTARHVDPGAFASPGSPLISLEDHSRLRGTAMAAPDALAHLRRGGRIAIRVGDRPGFGTVEGIVPAPVGNLAIVNVIIENPDLSIASGSAITIAVAQGTRAAVVVPVEAIVREGDLAGIVVQRGGSVGRAWVRVGSAVGAGGVEILSGLAPGDTIVVPGGP